jgi:hypothetical protein
MPESEMTATSVGYAADISPQQQLPVDNRSAEG